ncbi:MAG: hypothetical protein IJN37_04050 [Clostridia bacterium]|nr:hypothetical protein [Clostridia bacterium]
MKRLCKTLEIVGLSGTVLTMVIFGKLLKMELFHIALMELPFAICLLFSAILNERIPKKDRDSGRFSLITGVHHPIYLAALVLTADLMIIAAHFYGEKTWIALIAIIVIIVAEIVALIKIRKRINK